MADQTPSGIQTPTLGAITSGLKGYGGGKVSSTGANQSSSRGSQLVSLNLDDFLDVDVEDYEENDFTSFEEGQQISSEQKGWFEKLVEDVKKVGATIVVGATSIVSGIVDIAEAVVDGAAYLAAGAMDLIGLDDAAKATREFIMQDLVGDANDWLYGEGGIFEGINEASYFKYDSPEMQGLRDLSKKAGEFVLATVLTVCTGGLATAGVGFLFGLGEAAEDSYQQNGTDLTLLQNGMILLQGGASALSWYSQGKLGKGLVEIVKTANMVGIWETLASMKDQVFNKEFVKKLFSKGNVIGNIISTLAQGSGDIADICRRLVNGEEVTAEEWAKLFGELCIFFALNTLEDAGRSAILDFKLDDDAARILAERLADKTDDLDIYSLMALNDESLGKVMSQLSAEEVAKMVKDLEPEAAERVLGTLAPDKLEKVNGILQGTAEGTPDAPAEIPVEVGGTTDGKVPSEPEVDTPKVPGKLTDDDLELLAEDILDPNSATGFEAVKNLTDEELRKVMDCMTPEEMAKCLPSMDAETAMRVQMLMDGEETTRFIGQIGEDLSRGNMDPTDVTKLDDSLKMELQDRSDLTGYDGKDRQRIEWYEQDGISHDHAEAAADNYRAHSGDFTSEEDYYANLNEVEAQSEDMKWYQDPDTGEWKHTNYERIPDGDPGITDSVTEERMAEWGREVDAFTHDGKTTVHAGNNNPKGFEKFVLGQDDDYGTLGYSNVPLDDGSGVNPKADGWQFASLGDGDGTGMMDASGGADTVRKFEQDLGIPTPENPSDRLIMTTYDVDRTDMEMPTGREVGSNNQRLPGGRTPNGNTEAVHQTIHITPEEAKNIKVEVVPNDGSDLIWSGTLAELKEIQQNDPAKYAEIMGY